MPTESLEYKFNPATRTSRRPEIPPTGYVPPDVTPSTQHIDIRNLTDLKDINLQLSQIQKLFVSNLLTRTLAILIGDAPIGFETVKVTQDGYLKINLAEIASTATMPVSVADGANVVLGAIADAIVAAGAAGTISAKLRRVTQGLEDLKTSIALGAGTNTIGNVNIAGTSQTKKKAVINIATAATHTIVTAVSGKKIAIVNLVFTVAGDTNITLQSDATALTGAMDFGGSGEPKGLAAHLGDFPLETATGEAFKMTLSGAVQVSGFCTYFEAS